MEFEAILTASEQLIEPEILFQHTKALAAAEFQGRAPGMYYSNIKYIHLIHKFHFQ
jgi:hypothetical protein